MRWTSPEPPWPVLVTRLYLGELAHDSPGHSGHRFFQEIIELSRGRPELKPQDAVRVAEGYAYAYLELLRDGSLTLARGLVSSPAIRAELGVTDDASLLSCIAATLYLKPFDPIGSELLDELPTALGSLINGTGNNKGKRTSVLKRLSYLLMNRPKLAVFATARLHDMEGRDVQGHGAERIGSVAYSHFARESLLLTLLALCSGSPSRFLSELEDALDEILTPGILRAGELLRTLDNDFGVASRALSELLQAVIQPVQVNLDRKVRRKRSGAVQSVLDQTRIRDDHEEQHDDDGSTSLANESDDFDAEPRDTGIDDREDRESLTENHGDRHWTHPENPTGLALSKLLHELKVKRAARAELLRTLEPLRKELAPSEARVNMRMELERRLEQLSAQVAELAPLERTAQTSAPLESLAVPTYRPVLEAVFRSMEASDRAMDIKGHKVSARELFRLRFAAQWISALTGRDYTYRTRDQIAHDLSAVFSIEGDPITGDALRGFFHLVQATEKEIWGRAHDAALKTIVAGCLAEKGAPPAEDMLRDLRSKVRKALDGCFDADVEELVTPSPARVDLADPTSLLEIYWRTLYAKFHFSQVKRPAALGHRAAVQVLTDAVRKLALADANRVLPSLPKLLPSAPKFGALASVDDNELDRTAVKLDMTKNDLRSQAGRETILKSEALRGQYFLLQAAVELVRAELARRRQERHGARDIDPRKVKRFFTQTFSKYAGESDAPDDQDRPTWPIKDWALLARGLCRPEVSTIATELYERVRARFESEEEAEQRQLFQDLVVQSIDGVPFLDAFRRNVDGRLHSAANPTGKWT